VVAVLLLLLLLLAVPQTLGHSGKVRGRCSLGRRRTRPNLPGNGKLLLLLLLLRLQRGNPTAAAPVVVVGGSG
jgi:hypothetical protein